MANIKTNYLKGKVTSDSDGLVTFPKLEFTPNMIVVWSIQNDGDNVLFAAFYDKSIGEWMSQVGADLGYGQEDIVLSNASYSIGSVIIVNDGVYSYNIGRRSIEDNLINRTFNYVIYG